MKDAFIPLLRRIHGFLMASGPGDSPAVAALTNENVHEFTPGWAETTPVGSDEEYFDPGPEDTHEEFAADGFADGLESLRRTIRDRFSSYFKLDLQNVIWITGNNGKSFYLYITCTYGNFLIAKMTEWIGEEDDNSTNQTGFGIDCYYDDDNYIRSILNGTKTAHGIVDHYMFYNHGLEGTWQGMCTFCDRKRSERYDIACEGVDSVGDKLCEWMCSNYVPETPGSAVSSDWEKEVLRSWSDELVGSAAPEQQGVRGFTT